MGFCPLCRKSIAGVDTHLISEHGTISGSEEQKILCKLGRDRIHLPEGTYTCPLRKKGCKSVVKNPVHHLKGSRHEPMTTRQINMILRPLRWQVAMQQLRDLRTSGAPMVTSLDLLEEQPPISPASTPSVSARCGKDACERMRKVCKFQTRLISSLREQLKQAQVSTDFWYNCCATYCIITCKYPTLKVVCKNNL